MRKLVVDFWYIPCFFLIYLGLTIPFFVLLKNEKSNSSEDDSASSQKSQDFILCDESLDNFYVTKDNVPGCFKCDDLFKGCLSCINKENEDRTQNDYGYILADKETGSPDHSEVVVCDDDLDNYLGDFENCGKVGWDMRIQEMECIECEVGYTGLEQRR